MLKKQLLIIILSLCSLPMSLNAQNPVFEWVDGLGSTATDFGQAVAIDQSGNVISVGLFQSTIDLDPGAGIDNHTSLGSFDGYVSKVDVDGNHLWGFSIGQTGADGVNGVTVDATGNIFITGLFTGTVDMDPSGSTFNLTSFSAFSVDAFWAKYDPNGNFLNAYAWGGAGYDQGNDIEVSSTGQVYIIGDYEQTVDFAPSAAVISRTSNGGHDIFIARYFTDYLLNYIVTIGTNETSIFTDHGSGLDIDASGNIYVTGFFQGTMDMDPNGMPTNISSSNNSFADGFVAKYTGGEFLVWAKALGGTSRDKANDCTVDDSGNIYVTGEFTNSVDFNPGGSASILSTNSSNSDIFVSKYSTSGNHEWAFKLGGIGAEDAGRTIENSTSAIFVAGNFRGTNISLNPAGGNLVTSTGGNNGFIASYDLAGNHIWSGALNPTFLCEIYGIDANSSGDVAITGKFSGTTDFDTDATVSELTYLGPPGTYDAFVAKYRSLSMNTDFSTFSLPEQTGTSVIDDVNHTVDVVVPIGIDVTALVPTFSLSTGATVNVEANPQTSAVTANDFSNPVTYTVTAEDGTTTQNWVISVIEPPTITSFTPTSGPIGTSVTITGANFDPTPTNNTVFFGATQATISEATTTELTLTVPAGASYRPITVLTNGLMAYSLSPFITSFGGAGIDANSFATKVDWISPAMPDYSPTSIAIGDLDGDGKADLVMVSQSSNTISVFKSTSSPGNIGGTIYSWVDFTTGSTPQSVSIGDLDGDGKADLAVSNFNSNTVSIFRNISTTGVLDATSFAPKVDYATGTSPRPVSIGDLDGDGKADLAVGNFGSNTVSVFRNSGTSGIIDVSSFATKVDYMAGLAPRSISISDIDGDKKVDLVVVNNNSHSVSVIRNTSTAGTIDETSFANKVDFTTESGPLSVSTGDLDGDGRADLAVANSNSTVSILRNTSTPGIIDASSLDSKVDFTTGTQPFSVSIGDLDGDGKADLAVANLSSNTISVLRNTSTPGAIDASSFDSKVDFRTGTRPYSVSIGDMDGDGKADLATANLGNEIAISLLRNMVPIIDTDGDGIPNAHDDDDDNDGVLDASDGDPLDPNICQDADSDTCDDCSVGVDGFGPQPDNTPANDGTDTDADGICDVGDTDDDNDGVLDINDSSPLDNMVCSDEDSDSCDDCSSGTFDTNSDGTDTDADGICDAGDPDIDNDGVDNSADSDPLDSFVCSDTDADGCDDCSSGTFNTNSDGTDTDADGICDVGDTDDDNDGVLDINDSSPLDNMVCSDEDSDSCDDCSSGTFDTNSDGTDTDADGICDAGDPDIDNDGVDNSADSDPLDSFVCSDTDADGCDDCSSGTFNTNSDGTDTDADGICDVGDTDDDNDGVLDINDSSPLDNMVCSDEDSDSCDDCSSGTFDTNSDGTDTDADGICDAGDPDIDNDGVDNSADSDPLDSFVCSDTDADGCDDCSSGTFNTNSDGTDTDADGICDAGDTDDDNDGVLDASDADPLNPTICQDADADTCDDCSVQVDGFGPLADNTPANDGTDTDADGICDAGDTDDDNDGVLDASDSDSLDPTVCADADGNGCDDCKTGTDGFGPLADNVGDIHAPVPSFATLPTILSECEVDLVTPPTSLDDCSGVIDGVPNVTFPITAPGNTIVTWTYDDGNNNTMSQEQTITINDETAPVLDVSALSNLTDACAVEMPTTPTASDNCLGTINGVPDVNFPISSIGTTEVTWSFEDNNGNVTSQTQAVTISGLDSSVTQIGSTLTASANGLTYQWLDCDNGNAPISGETDQSFAITNSGNYAVEVDNGECIVISDCISVVITGINRPIEKELFVYPNPTSNIVNLNFRNNHNVGIKLLSMDGKVIRDFGTQNGATIQLNLMEIKQGIYLLRINSNGADYLQKIIIK